MIDGKWKVEFYGDGEYWSTENLTYEDASRKVNDCPVEYVAYMVPMEVEDD